MKKLLPCIFVALLLASCDPMLYYSTISASVRVDNQSGYTVDASIAGAIFENLPSGAVSDYKDASHVVHIYSSRMLVNISAEADGLDGINGYTYLVKDNKYTITFTNNGEGKLLHSLSISD